MSGQVPRSEQMRGITAALAQPFDPSEVKFKPQMVKNNRCLAMPYIDARLVQDRLDDVLGGENWQDAYAVLPDGSVVCTLRVFLGARWVKKVDVGSPSEQPDGGDRLKAAFSDALKRAAVKFGIGRYLYRLPASWVDYDPVKKQIVAPPQLPAWAVPPTPFERHAEAIRAAGTVDELKRANDAVNADRARLTPDEVKRLVALKDERKTALAPKGAGSPAKGA